jgi:Tfp pilus assembly ATPase PilU
MGADFARELGVRTSHERGHLFMPDLDEVDGLIRPIQRAEDAADPVAGIAIDAIDAPGLQPFDEEAGCSFAMTAVKTARSVRGRLSSFTIQERAVPREHRRGRRQRQPWSWSDLHTRKVCDVS